jgi:Dienelactone hydrolase family
MKWNWTIRVLALVVVTAATSQVSASDVSAKRQFDATNQTERVKWQAESRHLLFDLLKLSNLVKPHDGTISDLPFNVKVLSTTEKPHFIQREIELDSTPTRRIKAVLTSPKGLSGRAPAVVCIHGHGGNRYVVYDASSPYHAFAEELAKNGYVTISTDVGQHQVYEEGRTLMGERLWDLIRCTDYVASLDTVDPNRLGCAGLSLGGEMAMWLGAMDPRMKVTVSSGFLTTTENLRHGHCMCWDFPGFTENFNFSDIYSLIAPRPLLGQIGSQERAPGGFPPNLAYEAMASIQRAYAIDSAGDRARLEIHPGGHFFETASGCRFIDSVLRPTADSAGGE